MFGHSDNDNDEHKGQITLPEAVATENPGNDEPAPTAPDAPDTELGNLTTTPLPVSRQTPKSGGPTDDLLDIKQNALQALTPLVHQLEQTPEEKFRTTMMMIQASDNHTLIKDAYEAALDIASEKDRAQALLDIVNEINYFTQQDQAA